MSCSASKSNIPTLFSSILFLTCGTLIFELSLIRLFSVAQWYHFAFLVVSIAMLGLGAAGSFLTIFSKWLTHISRAHLSHLSFFFALGVVASYCITNQIPFDQQRIAWDIWQFLYLLLYYLLLAIPPFFTGLVLSSVYANYSEQIGKLYFFDILGAALGAIAVLGVSSLANGLGGIAAAALCGLVSSLLFWPKLLISLSKVLAFGVVGTTSLLEPALFSLNISDYKALSQLLRPANSKIEHTEWTPLARLDFVESPMVHFAPGLSLRSYTALPDQLGVVVDGDNLNAITEFDGEPKSLAFLDNLPSALPYHLSKMSSVLVCEPLGGLDILTALYYGVPVIDGAGIYNRIAKIAAEKFRGFSGGLYSEFHVSLYHMSPRAYLNQSNRKYDLISLPISDSFGAAGTGIYGASENYLFTVDAFTEYLQHLSENGWLVAACYILPPLRQELRLLSLTVSALGAGGRDHPEKYVLAIRTLETFEILVKARPITRDEITVLRAFCEERGFDLVFYQGITASELNRFNRFHRPIFYEGFTEILNDSTRTAFFDNYAFDVRPTTDDRPFLGHFFRTDKLREEFDSLGRRWTAFFEGGYLVVALFLQACLLSLLFIVSPLLISKQRVQLRSPGIKKRAILGYFFSIGLAYMLVEIVLIQRFILVLEHPLYAASGVIASLLVSSACGSYVSRKVISGSSWTIRRHLLVLCVVLVIYLSFLPQILNAYMAFDLRTRYLLAGFLTAIPGFLMGFPFPVGVRTLGQREKSWIPWAYCANGSASVIASSLAVIIALEWGFTWTMTVAVGCYFSAALIGLKWLK